MFIFICIYAVRRVTTEITLWVSKCAFLKQNFSYFLQAFRKALLLRRRGNKLKNNPDSSSLPVWCMRQVSNVWTPECCESQQGWLSFSSLQGQKIQLNVLYNVWHFQAGCFKPGMLCVNSQFSWHVSDAGLPWQTWPKRCCLLLVQCSVLVASKEGLSCVKNVF